MRSMLGRPAPITLGGHGALDRDGRPSCARPGCQGQTAAWLTYDYAGQRVWLDDLPSPAGDQWALCAGHAGRSAGSAGMDAGGPPGGPTVPRFEPPATLVS